jgi:predicted transcriptional regulator
MDYVVEREETIKRYLLGELPWEEQDDVELRVLTDRDYFTELLLVEDELTDDFICGALPDHEREKVRELFLTVPQRREKLKLTSAILRYINDASRDIPDGNWEKTLSEAQGNRELLGSLIDHDWLGLHLLALLRSSPQRKSELAKAVGADDSVISSVLGRLIQSGLVEDAVPFSCTERGIESLRKIEDSMEVQLA